VSELKLRYCTESGVYESVPLDFKLLDEYTKSVRLPDMIKLTGNVEPLSLAPKPTGIYKTSIEIKLDKQTLTIDYVSSEIIASDSLAMCISKYAWLSEGNICYIY